MEKYYRDKPHIAFHYLPQSNPTSPVQSLLNTKQKQQKQQRKDREGVRHQPVYQRADPSKWTQAFDSRWIASLQPRKTVETPAVITKAETEAETETVLQTAPKNKQPPTLDFLKETPKETQKETPSTHVETPTEKKEVSERTKGLLKSKSLKDRLKSNPLFRYKLCVC